MRLTSAEFVDRSEQLAVLDALWADVTAGVGRVVVVVGEAGIGKTRLLDEFVARSAQQAVVLRGGCVHVGGEALPLAPFRSALRSLLGDVDGRRWAPGELFDAVAGRLIAVSAESPVLLAAEDLHWADSTTLELVDYLARGLRGARVLLLVNVRDDLGAAATDEVLDEVARLPHAVRLVLPRLTPEGVIRVMQGILGTPPDAGMAQRVTARSGGVPFLVEELTAAERSGERGVPEQLHDLLLRRTLGLSAGARALLEAAAASAAGVDEDTLEEVTGMASEGLQEALQELIVAGLLTVDRVGGLLAFRHALLREAVEQDMLPRQAGQLHRRYAQLLDNREPDDPRAVIEAAYHWWLAGDPQRAYQASLVAADRAHTLGAFADELLLQQHALALHESDTTRDSAQPVGPDRPELRARAAAAALQVGEYDLAYELFEAAWRELGPTQRPARVARVLAAEIELLEHRGELPGVEDALQQTLAALPVQPNPARSYALKALLGFGFRRRDPDEQLWDLLQDALDGAAQDDHWAYGAALRGQAARLMSNCPGRAEEALALFAEARQYADAHDDAVHRFQSWINEADFLVALGRNAEAAQLCRAGLAAAAVHGASPVTWQYLRGNLAQALVGLGELAEAQHLVEQELCVDWPNLEWAGEYVLLGLVRVWRGEVEEATEAAEAAHHRLDGADVDPQLRVPLATLDAELALASGDREAALDIAARGCDRDAGNVWPVLVWPLLRVAARAAAPGRPRWLTEAVRSQAERYPPVPAAREEVEAILSGRDVTPGAADRPVTGPAALTPREREVLELLAAGRGNAAIAAELVISPKTASVHVSHILEKLMVRSRGEAAALAWRGGLVGAAADRDRSPRRGK